MPDAPVRSADPRVAAILEIVVKETGVPREALRPEATIEELGIASLDMAQALFALESHFDVEIPVVTGRSGAEFTTIGDLLAHVLATVDGTDGGAGGGAAGAA